MARSHLPSANDRPRRRDLTGRDRRNQHAFASGCGAPIDSRHPPSTARRRESGIPRGTCYRISDFPLDPDFEMMVGHDRHAASRHRHGRSRRHCLLRRCFRPHLLGPHPLQRLGSGCASGRAARGAGDVAGVDQGRPCAGGRGELPGTVGALRLSALMRAGRERPFKASHAGMYAPADNIRTNRRLSASPMIPRSSNSKHKLCHRRGPPSPLPPCANLRSGNPQDRLRRETRGKPCHSSQNAWSQSQQPRPFVALMVPSRMVSRCGDGIRPLRCRLGSEDPQRRSRDEVALS